MDSLKIKGIMLAIPRKHIQTGNIYFRKGDMYMFYLIDCKKEYDVIRLVAGEREIPVHWILRDIILNVIYNEQELILSHNDFCGEILIFETDTTIKQCSLVNSLNSLNTRPMNKRKGIRILWKRWTRENQLAAKRRKLNEIEQSNLRQFY